MFGGHDKILRDNIYGVTKPAMKRLAARAKIDNRGAVPSTEYEKIRSTIVFYLNEWFSRICVHMDAIRRKTVNTSIIATAVSPNLYSRIIRNSSGKLTEKQIVKIKNRLEIPVANFKRLVDELTIGLGHNRLKCTKGSLVTLQYVLETLLVELLAGERKIGYSEGDYLRGGWDRHLCQRICSRKKDVAFNSSIKRFVKTMYREVGLKIGRDFVEEMNRFVNLLGRALVKKTISLKDNKTVLTPIFISAVKMLLPQDLSEYALKWCDYKGIRMFPLSRVNELWGRSRVSKHVRICLGRILEEIAFELINIVGNACLERGVKTVKAKHIEFSFGLVGFGKLLRTICYPLAVPRKL